MSKFLGSSKVTSKFQVTIPQDAREFLEIKKGDRLAFVRDGNKVYIITKIEN